MARTQRTLEAETNGAVRLLQGWDRFFFAPADPTTLGLVRICCGLLLLYVHIAYTFDLRAFFGPGAWLDLPTLNKFRAEVPILAPSTGWEDPPPPARPDDPDEARRVDEYGTFWT